MRHDIEQCFSCLATPGVPRRPSTQPSQSYSSREEAIDGGRTVADELGFTHFVEEAEPTGTITDPQE